MGILLGPNQGSVNRLLRNGPPTPPNNQVAINAALQSADSSNASTITTVKMQDGKWTITTDGAVYNIDTNGQTEDTVQYITNYLTSRGASGSVIKSVTEQIPIMQTKASGNVVKKKTSATITDPNDTTKKYTAEPVNEPVNDSTGDDDTQPDTDVSVTVNNSTAWTFTTPNGTVYTVPMEGLAWSDGAKMHEYIVNYLNSIGAPANVVMEAVSRMPDVMGDTGLSAPKTDEFGNEIDNTAEIKNLIAGSDQSLASTNALKAFLDAKGFSNLSAEDQFRKALEYGIIPADSVYVPPDAGYNVGQNAPPGMPDDVAVSLGLLPKSEQIEFNMPNFNWAYLPKADADKYFAELQAIVGYEVTSKNLKQAIREANATVTRESNAARSEAIALKPFLSST
ncbi:serine/threonine protein phosphatase, partial [Dehalococcoides mccartyi]